jgi:hypothetical protein
MEKKKVILPQKRYANAPSEDLTLQVNFDEQKKFLTNDDRDTVIDIAELFTKERNDSVKYKIYGKMRMIFRNMYVGESPYTFLNKNLYLLGDGSDLNFNGYMPYNEFAFLRNDVYRQITDEPSLSSLSGFTGYNMTTVGDISHTTITPMTAPYHNWNLYISYVYAHETGHTMTYTLSGTTTPKTFVSGDGVPFRVTDMGTYYKLTSPVEHNMDVGEYLLVDNVPYYINSIGDENYDSENYVVSISKSEITGSTGNTVFSTSTIITGKRCLNRDNVTGTTSQYYVHKLKVATNEADYLMDKAGFESTAFRDEKKLLFENVEGTYDYLVERNRMESVLFDFKEPFMLSGMTNNWDFLPTEVYLSVIFRNGNGFFNYPPKVGWKFNFHDSWVDQHFSGTTSNESSLTTTDFTRSPYTFHSGNTLSIGDVLTGAFVEYSPVDMKETVISESLYRITPRDDLFNYGQNLSSNYYGASDDNQFGLFYQPHHRIKLRELSPYTETTESADLYQLPQNARYYPDEKLWKFRDVYDHGYIDDLGYGTDFSYLNDMHSVNTTFDLFLKNEQLFTVKPYKVFDFTKFKNANNPNNQKKNKNGNKNINC